MAKAGRHFAKEEMMFEKLTELPLDDGASFITPADVCAMVPGVTPNTLAIWRHYRRGPDFLKVGRRVFYDVTVVKAWLDEVTNKCDPDVTHLPRR